MSSSSGKLIYVTDSFAIVVVKDFEGKKTRAVVKITYPIKPQEADELGADEVEELILGVKV
jgi:hypothetical protein